MALSFAVEENSYIICSAVSQDVLNVMRRFIITIDSPEGMDCFLEYSQFPITLSPSTNKCKHKHHFNSDWTVNR